MNEVMILKDVSLKGIEFRSHKTSVKMSFIDMYEGKPCAEILCESVLVFNYHDSSYPDEMPLYVGEVNHTILTRGQLRKKLDEFSFGFSVPPDPVNLSVPGPVYVPEWEEAHHIHLEGGEILIHVLCKDVHIEIAGAQDLLA